MQMIIEIVARHEEYFRTVMELRLRLESEEILRVKRKQFEKADKRIKELDRLFIRLYAENDGNLFRSATIWWALSLWMN